MKVLIVTSDALGETMAGPAIRAFEIAKQLSKNHEVHLTSELPVNLYNDNFPITRYIPADLKKLIQWCEVLLFQGDLLAANPWISSTNKIIVADLYVPMHLEFLAQSTGLSPNQTYLSSLDVDALINQQLIRADFMICASEKQRDFWIGQLASLGRVNPMNYKEDSSLRNLVDVVPFGVDYPPPIQKNHGIRGVMPGVSLDDKIVIWGGGIYNWFDPLTLIKAIHLLSNKYDKIRLVFLGTSHPNPNVPEMDMSYRARRLSEELGLTGNTVFFNEGWVPYKVRADYLLDADLGVSTHFENLETRFSFRTRILDYIWAGLPIVSTKGDGFEAVIEQHGFGVSVPAQDVGLLASAIEKVLFDEKLNLSMSKNSKNYSAGISWSDCVGPLMKFLDNPVRSADSKFNFPKDLALLTRLKRKSFDQRLFFYSKMASKIGISGTIKRFISNIIKKFS